MGCHVLLLFVANLAAIEHTTAKTGDSPIVSGSTRRISVASDVADTFEANKSE